MPEALPSELTTLFLGLLHILLLHRGKKKESARLVSCQRLNIHTGGESGLRFKQSGPESPHLITMVELVSSGAGEWDPCRL